MARSKWALDPTHSEITFKVRHMMISNVTGGFSKFDATAETEEEDFTTAKVSFTADVSSVNTGNEQRDTHLQSPDFFDAAKFPQIRFTAENGLNLPPERSPVAYPSEKVWNANAPRVLQSR